MSNHAYVLDENGHERIELTEEFLTGLKNTASGKPVKMRVDGRYVQVGTVDKAILENKKLYVILHVSGLYLDGSFSIDKEGNFTDAYITHLAPYPMAEDSPATGPITMTICIGE